MLKFFNLFLIAIILCCTNCTKEATNTVGKLTSGQAHARLKKFPDLLSLNNDTEGTFEVISANSALGVTMNYPSKEDILGVAYANVGSEKGVDVGLLCVGSSCSKIITHQYAEKGVYYGPDNIGENDIFGKVISYKLQKASNPPTFEGEIYIPQRIKFGVTTPGRPTYINKRDAAIKWEADANNTIGVGVFVTFLNNQTGKSRGEVFLVDDNGILKFGDFIKEDDSAYTQVSVKLYRGNGLVKKGSDGKQYKLVIYSTCDNTFFFEP